MEDKNVGKVDITKGKQISIDLRTYEGHHFIQIQQHKKNFETRQWERSMGLTFSTLDQIVAFQVLLDEAAVALKDRQTTQATTNAPSPPPQPKPADDPSIPF